MFFLNNIPKAVNQIPLQYYGPLCFWSKTLDSNQRDKSSRHGQICVLTVLLSNRHVHIYRRYNSGNPSPFPYMKLYVSSADHHSEHHPVTGSNRVHLSNAESRVVNTDDIWGVLYKNRTSLALPNQCFISYPISEHAVHATKFNPASIKFPYYYPGLSGLSKILLKSVSLYRFNILLLHATFPA